MTKKENGSNAQPILAAVHSKTLVATLVHYKYGDSKLQKCVVINYYGQPTHKLQCEKELVFLANSLRQLHPRTDIVLCGDFNANWQHVTELAELMNLLVIRPRDLDTWHTRAQSSRGRIITGTLDYFLASHPARNLRRVEMTYRDRSQVTISDHFPIGIDFTLTGSVHNHSSIVFQNRIRMGIRTTQITEVLKDTNWPLKPFVDVAKGYKFTQICKFKKADAHYMLGRIRQSRRRGELEIMPDENNKVTL
jgi:hypothetical protein